MRLESLRFHYYDGTYYKKGEQYDVKSQDDAKALILVKAAKTVDGNVTEFDAAQENKNEKIQSASGKPAKRGRRQARAGSYSRRDMRAKSSAREG